MPKTPVPIDVATVVRYLRAGKSPKEIAFLIRLSTWAVWKFIERHTDVRTIYVETYGLRYPERRSAPRKIVIPLRAVQ